jgi:hypothetical protein
MSESVLEPVNIELIEVSSEMCLLLKFKDEDEDKANWLYSELSKWHSFIWRWDIDNKEKVILIITIDSGNEVIFIRPLNPIGTYIHHQWLLENRITTVTTYPFSTVGGLKQIHIPALHINLKHIQ